jgi:tripartite-type tricarboxylate transporter receptor subunit TctC
MRTTHLLVAMTLGVAGAERLGAGRAYPSRPIRLVIGFAPRGAADTVARAMSEAFGKALGQPVVVDNKPATARASPPTSSPSRRPTATRC